MLIKDIQEFKALLTPGSRLLGLDVGKKTIGVALSDSLLLTANPLAAIKRSRLETDISEILMYAQGAKGIIVGLPLNMDGSLGAMAQSTRQFAHSLAKSTEIPIILWDERLSTEAALRPMRETGATSQKIAANKDKLAATYILQGFLDSLQSPDASL